MPVALNLGTIDIHDQEVAKFIQNKSLDEIKSMIVELLRNQIKSNKHTKLDIPSKQEDDFLNLLANGPTISNQEAQEWQHQIQQGYNSRYATLKHFKRIENLKIFDSINMHIKP
jgi:hypothetical protein